MQPNRLRTWALGVISSLLLTAGAVLFSQALTWAVKVWEVEQRLYETNLKPRDWKEGINDFVDEVRSSESQRITYLYLSLAFAAWLFRSVAISTVIFSRMRARSSNEEGPTALTLPNGCLPLGWLSAVASVVVVVLAAQLASLGFWLKARGDGTSGLVFIATGLFVGAVSVGVNARAVRRRLDRITPPR